MPIESDLLPAEEFRRSVKKLAQEFFNKTGVRVVAVKVDWHDSMGGASSPVHVYCDMES